MALIRLREPLKRLAAGRAEHTLEGATVIELLRELERAHPPLAGWILDERGVVRHVRARADVRIELVDPRDDRRPSPFYLGLRFRTWEVRRVLCGREVRLLGIPSVRLDENPSQVVECRSRVVDDIADDEREFWRRLFENTNCYDVLVSSRLSIYDQSARLALGEGVDDLLELVDMLVGPFNL